MIDLLNVNPGEIFTHSVVYLFGFCHNYTVPSIEVTDKNGVSIAWSIVNNYFKAFVRLEYGKNEITLKTDNCKLKIILFRFVNSNQNKHVRVLYVVCKDDPTEGEFQSTDSNSNKQMNALKRISLGVELLQTFLSETMMKNSNKRKTFSFKSDLNMENSNACETFYTKLELDKALNMSQSELFISLSEEIRQNENYDSNCKYLAILSFTRYEPNSKENDIFLNTKGYCALGAEWLAVYGTPCLFSWAEDLNELEKCFTNKSLVDSDRFLNDTAFRNTISACYSTTLGSLLHEFSHILDLGHNLDGVMNRGFDDFYCFCSVTFDACSCYLNKLSHINKSHLIDSLTESLVVTENKYKNIKETRVLKWAKIKQPYFDHDDIYDLNLNRNHLVSSLTVTEKTSRFMNSKKTHIENRNFNNNNEKSICNCMLSCYYNDCNLVILFNHKWFNGVISNDCNQKYFDLIAINDDLYEITSVNKIVSYELRTLKRSLTFGYESFALDDKASYEDSTKKIKLSIKQIRDNYTSFFNELFDPNEKLNSELFNKKFERILGLNEKMNGFEIVTIDELGNIYKKKFHF